ncbi:MAG: sulfite exporter TauE/SafE family protein [Nibricoccus sp.]
MFFSDYLGVLVLGLLGSGHCIGMCGAFAIAASSGSKGAGGVVLRQVSYQAGKATSYVFLGVLLLLAGQWVEARTSLEHFQTVLGFIAGSVMIIAGLAYVFELRLPPMVARWWQGSAVCGALGGLWRSPSLFKSLLIGWVNGFLPCGLSLMALLYLVSFNSAQGVVIGAYVFGLATLPGLLAVALLGQKISLLHRRWLVRAGGVALVIFGVLTLVRGQPAVHHWMHEHLMWGDAAGTHAGHEGHAEHGGHTH